MLDQEPKNRALDDIIIQFVWHLLILRAEKQQYTKISKRRVWKLLLIIYHLKVAGRKKQLDILAPT